MRIVILAAGLGRRLESSQLGPKALTVLKNGQTILDLQLQGLGHYIDLHQITVVVGFHYEEVMKSYPFLDYVYNPDYATTNTAKSLLAAVRKIDDDLLFLNGDVVFHHSVVKTLLNFHHTSMLVTQEDVGDEEIKYLADRSGKILEVSKQVRGAHGEAVGINYISKEHLPAFLFHLEQCDKQDYFEKALEGCIQEGIPLQALPVSSHFVYEVDCPKDLERANALISEWS